MKEQHEKLSSLIDDFQQTEQDQSLLKDVLGDVNQQYTLRRYQMIGDVMRNEMPQSIMPDFAANVMAEIDKEPSLHVDMPAKVKAKDKPSWFWSVFFKPVAGLAVAATVAAVAVSNIQLQTNSDEQPEQIASATTTDSTREKVEQFARISFADQGGAAKVSINGQTSSSNVGTKWNVRQSGPDVQKKLNVYLINHNEFSRSWQGIIPQVRVVGFDAQK